MLSLIAAVAKNNVIGANGTLPWNIPEEMALFKQITMGHTLVVGRKTYESIGKDLPGRKLIVMSRSLPDQTIPENAFVIGGGQIYAQMMPLIDEMFISHLKEAYEGDCFFPEIEKNIWNIVEETEFPLFIHRRYKRI